MYLAKQYCDENGEVFNIPRHIAVIPDGNRRWAKERGLPAVKGHREGAEVYKKLLASAGRLGIEYVTFYAFSTENWKRSHTEVEGLMRLLLYFLTDFDRVMGENKQKIKFLVIGRRDGLSANLQKGIERIERETAGNQDLTALIAINYGGRDEITESVRRISEKVAAGRLPLSEITEAVVNAHLYTSGVPDPDLLIRTSGEERISNFLLWQLAYAEFFFIDKYWPDFNDEDLLRAIRAYSNRQRRYGGA